MRLFFLALVSLAVIAAAVFARSKSSRAPVDVPDINPFGEKFGIGSQTAQRMVDDQFKPPRSY